MGSRVGVTGARGSADRRTGVHHLAFDSLQAGPDGPTVVGQTVRVVDHVGVGPLLEAAFDLRDEPSAEIAVFVVEPVEESTPRRPDDDLVTIQYRSEGRDDRQGIRPADLADRLLSTMNRRRLMDVDPGPHLHASAVADDDGRVVLAMTRSHGGKSTLAAHLVHRGWHLVNDEQVRLLADHDMVGSFRRPIAIKANGVAHLPIAVGAPEGASTGLLVPARELGGTWASGGRPTVVLVLARDDDHEGPVGVRRLDPAEVVAACCANNLDLARDPEPFLGAFAWLASTVPGYELTYASSADAAATTERLAAEADVLDHPHAVLAEDASADDDHAGRWARAPEVITVGVAGQAVLYHRGTRTVAR